MTTPRSALRDRSIVPNVSLSIASFDVRNHFSLSASGYTLALLSDDYSLQTLDKSAHSYGTYITLLFTTAGFKFTITYITISIQN